MSLTQVRQAEIRRLLRFKGLPYDPFRRGLYSFLNFLTSGPNTFSALACRAEWCDMHGTQSALALRRVPFTAILLLLLGGELSL